MKNSMLETDLYQLSMALAYYMKGQHEDTVTFEGFVRGLPRNRSFLVFAGLGPLLSALREWHLSGPELAYLKGLSLFKDAPESFWTYLKNLRFSCEVRAPDEGTVLFAGEPFISVTGPLIQVQMVETLILNILNYSTAVASKAARIRIAAGPNAVLSEFGYRRAAGPDAADLASRAAFIGGFNYTSNLSAGMDYGIPVTGTMAHSYVMAHRTEEEAFHNYKDVYGKGTVLIDTFSSLAGTKMALETFGDDLVGVRLDSGDKLELTRAIREMLDASGNNHTKIIVSDDMDEQKISRLRLFKAPIDGYGVGTELVNPGPLGGVFKLVEYRYSPNEDVTLKAKLASGKVTYPGKKQVFRQMISTHGIWLRDVIGYHDEKLPGTPLLKLVMGYGTMYYEPLDRMQERGYANIQMLPSKFLSLDESHTADVTFSQKLNDMLWTMSRRNNG